MDADEGVTLLNKATNSLILDHVRDMLVLQGDTGSFQIEQIDTPEQHAWVDEVQVVQNDMYSICTSGSFRADNVIKADRTLTFRLHPGDKIEEYF